MKEPSIIPIQRIFHVGGILFFTLYLLCNAKETLSATNSHSHHGGTRGAAVAAAVDGNMIRQQRQRQLVAQAQAQSPPFYPDSRQEFWNLWSERDDEKCGRNPSFWGDDQNKNGQALSQQRPVLERARYLVVPIWWDGEAQNSDTAMDQTLLQLVTDQVSQQYSEMSYNKHNMTFEFLDQSVLIGITPVGTQYHVNFEQAVRDYVTSKGYIEFEDYTSIMVVANPFQSFEGGGLAPLNSNFMLISYSVPLPTSNCNASPEAVQYCKQYLIRPMTIITRHEIGHNYGHSHHQVNNYKGKIERENNTGFYNGFDMERNDMWDMMSGGNEYNQSDFPLASKWHYNWVTDDAIVTLQPEGKTENCPECMSSVTQLVLKPFDDVNVLPEENIMGVHIPILGAEGKTYSYWLSYRGTGNNQSAAIGLSVHVSWFSCGGMFGAEYDSLNYDTFGDTSTTTADSFVVPGTCYVVAPAPMMKDIDIVATEQVQPVVCVDDMDTGKSITISVTFPDLKSPSLASSEIGLQVLESDQTLDCSQGTTEMEFDVSQGKVHLLRYSGTGNKRDIKVASFCLQYNYENFKGDTKFEGKAYFYDDFPHAYMTYGSPPGYGAFASLTVVASPNCELNSTIDYRSEFGETYVLIVPSDSIDEEATIKFDSSCNVYTCHGSQYMDPSGLCQQCPPESVSDIGSTSKEDCLFCPELGGISPGNKADKCVYSYYDSSISTGMGWRLYTSSGNTAIASEWDVQQIEFFSDPDCSEESKVLIDVNDDHMAIDSGNGNSKKAPNAFQQRDFWSGRADNDSFWIGMEFKIDVTVRCVVIIQPTADKIASKVHIQARQESQSGGASVWRNVWLAEELSYGKNIIEIGNTEVTIEEGINCGSFGGNRPTCQDCPNNQYSCEEDCNWDKDECSLKSSTPEVLLAEDMSTEAEDPWWTNAADPSS